MVQAAGTGGANPITVTTTTLNGTGFMESSGLESRLTLSASLRTITGGSDQIRGSGTFTSRNPLTREQRTLRLIRFTQVSFEGPQAMLQGTGVMTVQLGRSRTITPGSFTIVIFDGGDRLPTSGEGSVTPTDSVEMYFQATGSEQSWGFGSVLTRGNFRTNVRTETRPGRPTPPS